MKKLLFFASLGLLFACSGDETEGGGSAVNIVLNKTNINISADGGVQTFTVSANGEWSIGGETGWCGINPKSGGEGVTTVTVTVSNSDLSSDRNTTLTVGDKTLLVTQKKKGALLLTQSKYDDITSDGETIEAEVNHNVEFNVVINHTATSWISKVNPSGIDSKALDKSKLYFKIAASNDSDNRYGEIYIISKEDSNLADTIKVYQVQKDKLVLTNKSETIAHTGGQIDVELKSNISYDVVMPEGAAWLRKVPTFKSLRTDEMSFIVDPFTDYDNRYAEIIFKDKNSDLADTISICQLANNALYFSQSIFNEDHSYHDIEIELNTNFTEFESKVVMGEGWIENITGPETKGVRQDTLKYHIYPNYSSMDREGRVVILDKTSGISDTVKIYQAAKPGDPVYVGGKRAMIASYNDNNGKTGYTDGNVGFRKILVSWRYLPTDPKDIAFDLYRSTNGGAEVKINTSPINKGTNFQDVDGDRTKDNTYRLTLHGSDETLDTFVYTSQAASKFWINIPFQDYAGHAGLLYNAETGQQYNDSQEAGVGDLDGDGEYEIVVKREIEGFDIGSTHTGRSPGSMILEAYKLNGTMLWRVDAGPNINQGAHTTQFIVFDFDGDGKAEVAMRTSEGTIFGDGTWIDANNNGIVDLYANTSDGRVNSGPEYFSVIDGATGRELARAPYIDRGDINAGWGKSDGGNRGNRFLMGVGYFDGVKPSVLICRGYYDRAVLETWDFTRAGGLTKQWRFDSKTGNNNAYSGQGAHSLRIGDVDFDGKDEIVYGACTIDHDGTGLYSTGLNHGDALHLGDFDPSRPGLEVFMAHESGTSGADLHDAKTGKMLYDAKLGNVDIGRGMIADIDPESPGCEFWWAGGNARSITGIDLGYAPSSCNMGIWWTGSLNRQLFDRGMIDAPRTGGRQASFDRAWMGGSRSVNGSKATPIFYGDILGDWREEVILLSGDRKSMTVHITDHPCDYKFPWLMTDRIYILSAATQNVAYNQPTNTSYYIGSDLLK